MTTHPVAVTLDVIFHIPPSFGCGIAQFGMQACLALVQEASRDHCLALGNTTRSTSVGAANLTSSMQHAICAVVFDTELDDVAAVCLRQHVLRLLQLFAFARGMQSEYAVFVLASKCLDRTCQHDNELTVDFRWTCQRHCFCVHVYDLLHCLPTAWQQGAYQRDK